MKNATILSLLLLCAVIHHCDCLPSKEKDVQIGGGLARLLRHLTKTNSDEHPLKKDFGTAGHSIMTSDKRSARGIFGCSSDEFRCSERGKCIPAEWVCDGDNDCPNNADEQDCAVSTSPPDCGSEDFQCPSGLCIPAAYVCDGDNDCGDNADEEKCAVPTSPPVAAKCGTPAIEPSVSLTRIVGGVEARKHSWPWQCYLEFKHLALSMCGGTVIGDRYILTAAHCLHQNDSEGTMHRVPDSGITVVCGIHDLKAISATDSARIIQNVISVEHEDYDKVPFDSDVAIIKLPTALTFNDYIQPVCLASSPVAPGTNCVVTGWGLTQNTGDSTVLRQAVVPTLSHADCETSWYGAFTKNMVCASTEEGKGVCSGDSGGPLVCKQGDRWLQYGINSFVYRYDCVHPDFPTVYANVVSLLPWIQEKTGIGPRA